MVDRQQCRVCGVAHGEQHLTWLQRAALGRAATIAFAMALVLRIEG